MLEVTDLEVCYGHYQVIRGVSPRVAGGIKFGSVEVAEVRFPLFFRRHELRPDRGGDGRYRGGPGCELELQTAGPAVGNTAGGSDTRACLTPERLPAARRLPARGIITA